jgi:lipopolysaccharide export system protein LptA
VRGAARLLAGLSTGIAAIAFMAPVARAATGAIGVVPFVRDTSSGAEFPDVGALLADRLATRSVERIVGPGAIMVEPEVEPADGVVRAWADAYDVAAVVVGRVTSIGDQLSLDVRLRSGETGAVIGTYAAETTEAEGLDRAIDDLAIQVLDGAEDLMPGAPSATAPPAPVAASAGEGSGSPFGIHIDGDQPISIRSDRLESSTRAGSRTLLFTDNVVVTQDDVTIRSERLEAVYPPKANQPSRLVATGSVQMSNATNEARCDHATYERDADRLVCRGNAELRDGNDCVAGNWIEFDLNAETVTVGGGATVVLGGDDGKGSGGTCR